MQRQLDEDIFGVGADGDTEAVEVEWEYEMLGEEGKQQRLGRGVLLSYDCLGCNLTYVFLIPWGQIARMATLMPIRIDGASVQQVGRGYRLHSICKRCLGHYDAWDDRQQQIEATTVIDLSPYIDTWVNYLQRLQAATRRR